LYVLTNSSNTADPETKPTDLESEPAAIVYTHHRHLVYYYLSYIDYTTPPMAEDRMDLDVVIRSYTPYVSQSFSPEGMSLLMSDNNGLVD